MLPVDARAGPPVTDGAANAVTDGAANPAGDENPHATYRHIHAITSD